MDMIKLQQVDLRCKRVLLRADLNVSVEDGEITSEQRILASLDSVRYALENNAAVLIISHFGRPKAGEYEARYSLVQVREAIQNCLDRKVRLIPDWINGFEIKPGEIALGENVRFLEGEVTCDPQLSQKMARLCDVFVMDAVGAAHRAHASISGVVEFAPVA
ncbi:MAG: phosphoglycerate kinase, partial [Gammaproteobacteria bacterium]|nr:phosphoglycerate kinase [Gammaproteobacteria bacterium]